MLAEVTFSLLQDRYPRFLSCSKSLLWLYFDFLKWIEDAFHDNHGNGK